MLFYFSGTGNSRFVATTLSNFLGLGLHFIPETDPHTVEYPDQRVLFVFPVYSWGVPPLVESFIKNLPEGFWMIVKEKNLLVDCVMVCGDEVALAPEMFRKILTKVSIDLNSVWSVIMPNNYVLLPGFDVDPKDVENSKLDSCKRRILEIAEGLNRGDRRINVSRGKMPGIKTKLVYPLFKKWGIFSKKWHYTSSCIGCGKCAQICPMKNIEMKEGHPYWNDCCCSCLACYHICPVHAVAYGKETRKKGQYFFPLRKI